MALITFLVEDNKTIRDNLVPALEDLVNGQVVGFAETESDALSWLASHPRDWQLLIVDLFLKEGSGLGVLSGCKVRGPGQRVVVRGPGQRVVVLSNYVTADIRARCEALGADAVLDKSRDLDAFIEYCNTDRPSSFAGLN